MLAAPNFDDLSLSLNIIAILKWKLPLEPVEKVVSKTECPKSFQLGLNYHKDHALRRSTSLSKERSPKKHSYITYVLMYLPTRMSRV